MYAHPFFLVETLKSQSWYALVLCRVERYEQAARIAEQYLPICERALGRDSVWALRLRCCLTEAYCALGRYEETL